MNENIERAMERIARAQKTYSQQPRFNQDTHSAFRSLATFIEKLDADALRVPEYRPDSRRRDTYLQQIWRYEPYWSGIMSQAISVDSSRGWSLIGGRNQVKRYTSMLHNAENGKGWRMYFRKQSLAYRCTDFGATTEIGREGEDGPMREIYHLDGARCKWSGNLDHPLYYYPTSGKMQQWPQQAFFNVCAMPSDTEQFNGLGYSMTSRAFDILRLMYAVLMHDTELAQAKMPRGILLLNNITELQWETALQARNAKNDGLEREYFGGVMTIAGMGTDQADVNLVGLSQLPANFDRETFINQTMYGYALVAGFDPREFWPVSGGSLGSATETEEMARKTSTKGALEFPHAWQEQFQQLLPDSLHFEFEERDLRGELVEAEVANAWADFLDALKGDAANQPVLSLEEQRQFLAMKGVIPVEWTEAEEDALATDEQETRSMRDRFAGLPSVQRAARQYPNEPIVRYSYGMRNGRPVESEVVLWSCGDELTRPRYFAVNRQNDTLYEGDGFTITEQDVDNAIAEVRRLAGDDVADKLIDNEDEPIDTVALVDLSDTVMDVNLAMVDALVPPEE